MWLLRRKKPTEPAPTLAELFAQARRGRAMTRHECARAAGYQNVVKGCRRLCEIERGETVFADERVLARFADALAIPDEAVRRAQRAEIERYDEPVDPQVMVRWAPKVTAPLAYPAKLSGRQVLDWAARFARENLKEVCVRLSHVRTVKIQPDGRRTETLDVPWQRVAGELPRVEVA